MAGTLVYTALWIGAGHLFGAAVLERGQGARLILLAAPAAILIVLAVRVIRRRRYGAARISAVSSSRSTGPRRRR